MSSHEDIFRLLHLLKSCSRAPSLRYTKPLHALTITSGPHPIYLYNNVVTLYSTLGEIPTARKLFDKMPDRNVVSFNTIISACSRSGYAEEAWKVFRDMRYNGFRPTQFTFGGLLSCDLLTYSEGIQLQGLALKNGLFYADAFVGTALLGLYGRVGCWGNAVSIFNGMPNKSLVTWNSIISILGQNGYAHDCLFIFRQLVREDIPLSECSFVGICSALSSEQDLEFGDQVHGLAIKNGLDYEVLVLNSLINMYVKCMDICSAEKIFVEASIRDVVSWNTIIGALVKSGKPKRALELFTRMHADRVFPNQTTYVHVTNACVSLLIPMCGKSIHAEIIKNGIERDVFVGSALVDFYAKCDILEDGHRCFDEISHKNVVSWNSLIMGYANKCLCNSILLLIDMLRSGYRPNEFTFSHVLKSSMVVQMLQLHSLIIRMGYENNDYVLSSLMTSYARNGQIPSALAFVSDFDAPVSVVPSNIIAGIYNRCGQYHETIKLLSLLDEPDMVSWNIVIAACAHNGNNKEAFDLFKQMQLCQILADGYTFVSLLSICTKICSLALGGSLHGLIIKTDIDIHDTFLCNVLMDMYGKCGSIRSSLKIFDRMRDRNIISWTVLISTLGLNGFPKEALKRFREMESLGFNPDKVTFIAVLSACRHGGLVREGIELFGRMHKCYGLEPEMDHYSCFVDLLARNGNLKDAEKTIASMPFPPNALIWRSFLEGCRRHRTAEYLTTTHNLLN